MKEKKVKLWQIIAIIILLIIILVVGMFARKVNILKSIDEKIDGYNAKDNAYVKIVSGKETTERYKKGYNVKFVTPTNFNIVKASGTMGTIYTYTEKDGKKVMQKTENVNVRVTMLENCADTVTDGLSSKVQLARSTKISSTKVDGKDCYVLSQDKSKEYPTWYFPDGCSNVTFYVEKDTGLPIKRITKFADREEVMTFEYSFDTVTDADLEAPTGYEEITTTTPESTDNQ